MHSPSMSLCLTTAQTNIARSIVTLKYNSVCSMWLSSFFSCPDKDGNHPLHYACGKSRSGIVNLLLEAGADIAAVDRNRRTPLHKVRFVVEVA